MSSHFYLFSSTHSLSLLDPPHLRQNGLPEELEPQVIPSDYPIETSSHVTSAAEQGEMAVVTGGERYSPQDMHKDDKSMSN